VTWWRYRDTGRIVRKIWRRYGPPKGKEVLRIQFLHDESGRLLTTEIPSEALTPCPEGPNEEEGLAWTLAILQH
jgi:hypothetical protein